ncbi:hypothetical protein SAMN05518845_103530 [Variovorax sp. YR750]|uniref:sialidase family protein n=1 Tax=Variovorax sp. YR750 TaxID=1884384 RepID=UPI0008CCB7C2|nr:sialidase family protein [Variovorax sp. YR750]SEK93339.1 hypothetical protein SAMN05518845_103530 [Variovorax sp. YR750]
MKKRHAASLGVLVLSTLIASCGGGGGGGGGGGFPGLALPPANNTPPPANNPAGAWLTFNPSPVELTVFPNASKTFAVVATSTKVISAPVNVGIIEPKGVITTNIKIASAGLQYTATMSTNPALAPGVHTGNFEVRACYDANPLVCSQPVEGSPWQVPYKITVIDPASLHYSRWEAAQKNAGFTDNFALSYVKGKLVVEAANYYDATMETWTSSDVGNTWVKLLPPTIPSVSTKGFALASDGDAIYLSAGQSVGSYGKPTGQYLNHVWKFDGTDWTQKTAAAEFPGRMDHVMAKVGNTLYVVAGRTASGDVRNVWKSDNDGVNWTQIAQGLPAELGKPTCALNWKGSLLLVGDKVATSSDGANFTIAGGLPATFPKNSLHCAVLDGRLFISPTSNSTIGSTEQNAMSTTDLATWQIERSRPFSTPDAPGMVAIDGRLVVTTGQGTSERTTYRTVP